MKFIPGGVTAPVGYRANGLLCGIKKGRTKPDLALIVSDVPASAAGVYTSNLVKGAPVTLTKKHLENGVARAVLCNSGNANTCNPDGPQIAEDMCELLAAELGIAPEDVIIGSTGVIGQPLPIEPVAKTMPALVAGLSVEGGSLAAEAIMTTDTVKKEFACELELGGKTVRIGLICKGSGMIAPNMATMLCFITTDAAITAELLHKALKYAIDRSINCVVVDGDQSTNDTAAIMANGLAGNALIESENGDYLAFREALCELTASAARLLASDGEGATRLLTCHVTGAPDYESGKTVARTIIGSSLVKCAFFGADANWGRILCAIGYAGVELDVTRISVTFESASGRIDLCRDGAGLEFDEELAKKLLCQKQIDIIVHLGQGDASATAWGCDMTYDYVKINGDYRT